VSAGAQRAVSRRGFLKSMLGAGGALVVGIELFPGTPWTDAVAGAVTAGGSIGVYITIGADESITLTYPGAEMGQGASTGLAQIIAEELMVDWSKVKLVLGGYDPLLNRPTNGTTLGTSQSTGGSNSVRGYHDYLRNVGATARQKLIWAASSLNSIPVAELTATNGTVVRTSDGSLVATYGALAETAVTMAPTDVAWVSPPYRIIGQPVARLDVPPKVNGSAVYGIDIRRPGMRYASVKLAPKVGQTVGTIGTPPSGTLAVPVPGGVAVITSATNTWSAIKIARSLSVSWVDAAYTTACDSAAMKTRAADLMATGTAVAASGNAGDANAALAAAPVERRYSGTYSVPYLAHATMEPMNTTALVTDTSCEIWSPTQVQTAAATAAAAITGLPNTAITIHTTYLGGGLGRRLETDYVKQAVTAAMAVKGTPVKLVWSREEDMTHDVYRPASLTTLEAAVDDTGLLTALKARVVCPSSKYQKGTLTTGAVDNSAVDGIYNNLYAITNKQVEWVLDTIEVPVGSWRSVGNSQNCFFLETFLDEIATGTAQDPIAFRRRLLASGSANHLRALAVLDALVAQSGWNTAPASGRARGMALSMSFGNTIVGEVAEVSGSFASGFKVHTVTVVIDPGSVINPDSVRAQVESSVHQGLQAAMWQGMTFTAGEPMRKNFNTYRMARLSDMPAVNTTIIQSGAALGGIGEPSLPPIAPAVVNAIAKLTGVRVRSLPIAEAPVPPQVTSFTPASGPVGTVVTLTGYAFTGATAVAFNGVPATVFNVVGNTQITAQVPAGASTGKITVTTSSGTGTSSGTYTVTTGTPLPWIGSFTPTSGAVGTVVTVNGANFTGATAVKFNGVAATTFAVVSATRITATVPTGATSGKVSVTTPAGTGSSSGSFSVTVSSLAPKISSFTPSSGPVGATVTITGSNFTGTTAVAFNGLAAAAFTVVSNTQITATVPSGATTGRIAVTNGSGTGTSSGSFTVTVPSTAPTISSFSPTVGPVGTTVTINGTNLSGVSAVTFNGVAVSGVTVVSANQLTVAVPVGATTGKIVVTTADGTATSSTSFTVGVPSTTPTISSFSPTSGPIGAVVTVNGTNLAGATAVKFNGVAATTFTVVSASQLTATVPSGATTGKVSVTTPSGTATSSGSFTVTVAGAPTISKFSPSSGRAGTTVTLTGTNFSTATAVRFNGTAATFTINSATKITTVVPPLATTGPISVTNPNGTATTRDKYDTGL